MLSGNIENFSGDKKAVAVIGILSLGLGGEARAEASMAKEVARGFKTVGRWMSKEEHELMLSTNKVQESLSGTTHVANPANPEAFIKQAKAGSRYIEFNVPASSVKSTGDIWAKIIGPNTVESKLAIKKGLAPIEMPSASDIQWIASKLLN